MLHGTEEGLCITDSLGVFLHNKGKVTLGTCVFDGLRSAACGS